MQLNEKQQLAISMAADWYAKQNTQIFKMAGYAGTGKTTTLRCHPVRQFSACLCR